ncbi:MAG TPA: hypothetical protein VGM88_04155 [Kofleriaceae bacterium]|jgi:hypothetical protein
MRFWGLAVVLCAACTDASFDYQAQVTFSDDAKPVLLNHQEIESGYLWDASYSTFTDAIRDPSVIEFGGQTITIGPTACQPLCHDCQFDAAVLSFDIVSNEMAVTGACDVGADEYTVH